MSEPTTPAAHMGGLALLVECDALLKRGFIAAGTSSPARVLELLDEDSPSDHWTTEHARLEVYGTVPAPGTPDRARAMWRALQRKDPDTQGEQVMREDRKTADGGRLIVRTWNLRQRVKCNRWEACIRRAMEAAGIEPCNVLKLSDFDLLRLRDFLARSLQRAGEDGQRFPEWPAGWREGMAHWNNARRTSDKRRRDTQSPEPANHRGEKRGRATGADSRARGPVSRSRGSEGPHQ